MLTRPQRRRNKRLYGEEMVFCIPASETVTLDKEFWTYPNNKIPKALWGMFDEKGNYMKRAEVEGTSIVYQVVPYITLANQKGEILAHIHKKTGNITLGFSKHIGPECGTREVLAKSCMEIILDNRLNFSNNKEEFKGFIKTFTEETKGHIGVFFVQTTNKSYPLKEDNDFEYKFMSIEELLSSYGKLEKWARIALNFFYEKELEKGEGK